MDFEDSVEKLHKTNRYRHELEIRYKALQITCEKQEDVITEKEGIIQQHLSKIELLRSEIQSKDTSIRVCNEEIKDLQDELSLKLEEHGHQMESLNQLVKTERVAKNDWAIKFKSHDNLLSER